MLIDEDRVPVRVYGDETSVKEASLWALLSQPGLKVSMVLSNIP